MTCLCLYSTANELTFHILILNQLWPKILPKRADDSTGYQLVGNLEQGAYWRLNFALTAVTYTPQISTG